MYNRQPDMFDMLSFMSFLLGYENLMENREQSRQNDVGAANDKQANYLLQQLSLRFGTQDEMLKEILARLDRLEKEVMKFEDHS